MNVLELFCGTKSIGKCCEALGWDTISLDYDKQFNATHTCDILDFDYKQYPKNHFDIIWASPDCRYYSRLQNTWIGRKKKDGIITTKETIEENRKYSDTLIYKVWEIIDYFNPELWFVENPLSPLKDREVMKGRPYYIVDYCKYSDWGYRKRTCIWTNKKDWTPLTCNKDCNNMVENQHKNVLANGYEMIDGKKVLCNTKEKRDQRRQMIHKERMGTSKTIEDNGKIIRVNTAELRKKYKDYPNLQKGKKNNADVSKDVGGGTNRLERYRVPEDLIYSLFLD